MFLQMQNRRQFLERSAWGFGSAFVLPSLLQSCTDHNLPGPDGTIIYPPLGDDDIDWSDKAKALVKLGLVFVPEGGEIIGGLVDLFWPGGNSAWAQVRAQVEALIDEKISELVYQQVSQNLDGLNNVITLDYKKALKYGTKTDILQAWNDTKTAFDQDLPNFKAKGYEVLLLPLFTQYVNMYLSLLRDGVFKGLDWGMTPGFVDDLANTLTQTISDFTTYTKDTYEVGLSSVLSKTQTNYEINEPFKSTNAYSRQMTLWVLDFMDTWPYYDGTTYNNGATVEFNREIYSDPFGNTYVAFGDRQPIILPPPATQRPTSLTVWGGSRVDAVQLTYPAGGGPGGVTTTPRMGDQKGGSIQAILSIPPDNPIIQAQVSYDYYENYDPSLAIDTMFFLYNDGNNSVPFGGKNKGQFESGVVGYDYMALSSIYIQGTVFGLNNSANCIVFGFMYWNLQEADLSAVARIYITSPKEPSVADFAKALPKLGLSANSISEELKAARKAYWELMEKRFK